MRPLPRVLVLLCVLFCTSMTTLPSPPSVQAAPAPGGPGALRLRVSLQSALQQLTGARVLLSRGHLAAMNAAISRAVVDLQRATALLAPSAFDPAAETIAALLADFTATDLSEDPLLAAMLLERGCAELDALLTPVGIEPQSGRAGRVVLNPTSADFGILCPGEEKIVEVQVTNKTTTTRRLRLNPAPDGAFRLTDDSPTEVAAGATVTLQVKFKIDTLGRYRKASLLHAEADGQPDAGIFLNVTATTRTLLVEPFPLDFDEVVIGESKTMNVTVRNCTNLQITAGLQFSLTTSRAFSLGPNQAPQIVIPAGGMTEVALKFTPTVVSEVKGTVQVFITNGRREEVIGSGNLLGRGKEPVKVGARTLNFGMVAAREFHTRTLGIENNTSLPQEITVDRARLHSEYWGVTPAGPVKLLPNSVTQITLRFGAIGRCQHRGTLLIKSPKLKGGKASVAVSAFSR